MPLPRVVERVTRTLRPRICNTRPFEAVSTEVRELCGQDNNRQGVVIQNKDTVNSMFVTFNQSTSVESAIMIPPTGIFAVDFSLGQSLYCFTLGASVQGTILEITGFDTFQLLMARLVEQCVDRLGMGVDLLALCATRLGADPAKIREAMKSEV